MNLVLLTGNLGQDPRTGVNKETGNHYCSFSIATTDGYGDKKKTNWHKCVAFGKSAEYIGECIKGDKLMVQGVINYGTYEDKPTVSIIVNRFEKLSATNKTKKSVTTNEDGSQDVEYISTDKDSDEIPF